MNEYPDWGKLHPLLESPRNKGPTLKEKRRAKLKNLVGVTVCSAIAYWFYFG